MKYKTTDREQRNNNYLVVAFGYCSIQNVERFLSPSAYTCGVYGWRADFYNFGNVTLSTGYAPLSFASDKLAVKRGAYIKKKVEALNKKIEKLSRGTGDWFKMNKKTVAKIEKIINDAWKIEE